MTAVDDRPQTWVEWVGEAVIVSDADPGTPEWFAARRAGITGTDIPKILGLSKYGDAGTVYADKTGLLPPDHAGEAADWGHILEDPVAQEWAKRRRTTVQRVGVIARADTPWMRISLDRTVDVCPDGDGPCTLEVKTRSAFKDDEWKYGGIPDDVLAQTRWGLVVTGYTHTHVAVLVGGQKLREVRVDVDAEDADLIRERATALWECVQKETPPDVEGGEHLTALLNAVHQHREGDVTVQPDKVASLLADYRAAHAAETDARAAKDKAKSLLLAALGDGKRLLIDGHDKPVVTVSTRPSTSAKWDRIRSERPDVYAALVADGYITATENNTVTVNMEIR